MSNPRHWTPHQLKLLRELYPDFTAESVALAVGRSKSSVWNKANQLGLRKSEAFWKSDISARVQRAKESPQVRANQFPKGIVPWNKGIPGSTGTHPNSRATQFKKGMPPRNSQPVGSLRVNKEGLLQRKVSDDNAVHWSRWQGVHRLVWEKAHGAIPKGHVVRFKPGTATNKLEEITLDKLECISKSENMMRNSIQVHPTEMIKIYQLKGAITRQVNRIVREHKEATT